MVVSGQGWSTVTLALKPVHRHGNLNAICSSARRARRARALSKFETIALSLQLQCAFGLPVVRVCQRSGLVSGQESSSGRSRPEIPRIISILEIILRIISILEIILGIISILEIFK